MKSHASRITLLMKLVEKADVETRKLKASHDLQSYRCQEETYDDYQPEEEPFDLDEPEVEGLGMELKLYFDFGPTNGTLLLVRSSSQITVFCCNVAFNLVVYFFDYLF